MRRPPDAAVRTFFGHLQNLEEVTVIACALDVEITQFAEARTEINEDGYPLLWKLKNGAQDAALNSLPEMALSPQQLMQTLKDTKGEAGAPFGRLPPPTIAADPELLVRRLVCLELPDAFYAHLPMEYVELIDKVVQHRRSRSDGSAGQPALITEGDTVDGHN